MSASARSRAAAVVTLTEPELWAVIRSLEIEVAPSSPLAVMARAAATLDRLRDAGLKALAMQGLAEAGRVNSVLGAAVEVLSRPEECFSIVERGALGTLMRAYYGVGDLFVGHTPLPGSHTLAFPYTRAALLGLAAATVGLSPSAAGETRRG
jgi:hypothetical protein